MEEKTGLGGAVAVLQALQDVVTPAGTLVMPTFTSHLSDPARWRNPPVPPDWWPTIRAEMPAFDASLTPSWGMGAIPELFRTWPGVRRSDHPHHSFAAWGQRAELVTGWHPLAHSLGEESPLARVYELGGQVLLGTNRNTSLHLAEIRAGTRPTVTSGAPVLRSEQRQWVQFEETDYDDEAFGTVKDAFEAAAGEMWRGRVGLAEARLMPRRALVDFTLAFWR